ncbi:phenolic glucoside malonyltransferase 1-like [Primulina huaijiensis]|uniref:phenolic glucoside malonyltransferase 1-like n=1 Tax=Primulina huaijiensis TaxID=1492673 RepID=UPI003CC72F20
MAASTPKAAAILDYCRVAPPSTTDSSTEQRLPLSFFDMPWLHFHPVHRVLLYQFPCSKSSFLQTIVPTLKNSLAHTLQHYLPLAGNLLYPLDSGMPEFCYFPGDSVSVTIAESSQAYDFDHLTGNGFKDANEFYPFVPDLPEPRINSESGFKIISLLAIQITLFPDSGICIGISNHHVVGDASSTTGFIRFWSSVARLGGDEVLAQNYSLPFFERSGIKDPSGISNIYWNQMKIYKRISHRSNSYADKVRATYILRKDDIQKLKNLALSKNQALLYLSTFTVTTAYVWTCLVKSAASTEEEVDPNEPEHFTFAADARPRLNPPLPVNYFGNCVAFMRTESTHHQLKGNDGFLTAVELIGDVISKKVNKSDEILRGAESWITEFSALIGKRLFGVAGCPKFDAYDADFGWGEPKKFESVSIDADGSMSLCKSREFEGGLEIGLSLAKAKMDAFAATFSDGLKIE